MMTSSRTPDYAARRQRGIALIMALVFLLLLTIIGVTAMTTTSLQQKMAGNVQNKNSAFQAAESALRVGEAYVKTSGTLTGFTVGGTTTGLYLPAAATAVGPIWNTVDWDDCNKVICLSGSAIAKVTTQPKYIIEEVASTGGSGGGASSSVTGFRPPSAVSGGTSKIYRISARGTGSNDNAIALVQSVYRK